MPDYFWFILISLIMITATWLLKKYAIKSGRQIIDEEKYYPGIMGTLHKYDQSIPPALSGKEAIRMAKIMARAGDLLFWVVLFSFLIFAVSQFENIFMGH